MVPLRLIPILESGEVAEPVALPVEAAGVLPAMAAMYRSSGYEPPWTGYIVDWEGCTIGTCAFKSAPVAGRVEIAYFTFPSFEGRGLATAMAEALVALARSADPGVTVAAQTLPERNASNRVLEKLGFRRAGTAIDAEVGEVWEWQLASARP